MIEQVKFLQEKIGAKPDGLFGKNTAQKYMEYFERSVPETAHILGQSFVESMGFTCFEENLNYASTALALKFPKYFDSIRAKYYFRKPEDIANYMYADRMGNGDVYYGDGWRHRGFGAIQLTGKDNQFEFAEFIKDPRIKKTPDLIAIEYAFEAGEWFFNENKLWDLCQVVDRSASSRVSRAVNRGNAFSTRKAFHEDERFRETLKVLNWLT